MSHLKLENFNIYTQLSFAIILFLIFAGFMLLEKFIAKRRNLDIYYTPDVRANFGILVVRFLFNVTFAGATLLFILNIAEKYSLHLASHLPTFWYWFLLIVGQDLMYYWYHRYSHMCRWGWASHIVHHSSNYLNFVVAIRESATYLFSGIWVFWLPLVLVGFTPTEVIIATFINLVYQFFLHTQLVGKLGFIEYIFNTPSHHRVHHARNPQYVNKNYAGIFILWDRIFGTFVEETEKPDYGLVHQVYAYNPFYLLFQGWYEMFRAVVKRRNLKYLLVFPKAKPQD